jgi:hypothetical protein
MVPVVYWFITLVSITLPLLALLVIGSSSRVTGARWWLRAGMGILLMAFSYQASVWAIYSVYLKYVFVAAAACLVMWSWFKRSGQRHARVGWIALSSVVSAALALGNLLLITARSHPKSEAVDLQFPLRHGTYYVIQGGNSRISNFFHSRRRSQKFAVDIIKLNALGRRSSGLLPGDLDRYEIYGDTIYAPHNGIVISAVDGQPESVPPTMVADEPLGNGLAIDMGQDRVIIIAHMKPGSVMVSQGERVQAGQPIGLVGNSGRSAEPHLHIKVVIPDKSDNIFRGEPVPMRFDGRFLTLNDVVENRVADEGRTPPDFLP